MNSESGQSKNQTSRPVEAEGDRFDISPFVDEVAEMVRTAGRLSMRWYRDLDHIENKRAAAGQDGFDPVTEADRAVEIDLRERLGKRFPDHAILGEEFGLTGDGPYRWIIDPIDGTRAFITGQPMWGTLLGLLVDDRPVAGWMYQPVLDETLVGHEVTRLMTATETRVVATSTTESLSEATVLSTDPSMFAPGDEVAAFTRVVDAAKLVRYSGDCVNYGLLSMGLVDSVVENQLKDYDIIPLIPIIRAAGGIVTNLEGEIPVDGGFVVASATPALHAETLATLDLG